MSPSTFNTSVFAAKLTKPNPNGKRYQCTQCSKNFSRPSALQTHVYTHTGEKPHQCDIAGCGRRFAVISNLRRHLRVHKPNYVRRRLTSQERREYVERLIQKSGANVEEHLRYNSLSYSSATSSSSSSTRWLNPVFENSYRLLKPKDTRPLCLRVKHLLN